LNNYKLLPPLISILQTRNLTESARALNVTQSAMSKTLSLIRDAFGDQILIREGNKFVLTKRGELLKSSLPVLISQLDNLYLPSVLDLLACKRKFVLASSDYVAQFVLPDICAQMLASAPNISVEYQLWQKNWLSDLSNRDFDLVSTIVDQVPENLHGKKMAEDDMVVVMRKNHLQGANQVFSVHDYIAAQHIAISGGGDKDSLVDDVLLSQGLERKILSTVPFFQAAMALLVKTETMLTTPLHIAANLARQFDLIIKPLPLAIPSNQYYVLWHAKNHHDPEHKWFREICFSRCKSHLDSTLKQGMKLVHGD
jgi:DNA-binding transcriptional LysR family regulator